MSVLHKLGTGVAVGSIVVGGLVGASAPASAGTKPPPCTKKAVKVALKGLLPTLPPGAKIDAFTKVCAKYYAGGGYSYSTPDGGSGSDAYLLQASGGKWKVVPFAKHNALCDKGKVPKKVAAKACRLQ